MSHKAKLYLQSFQVLEPMKYISMKLVDLVIGEKPYKNIYRDNEGIQKLALWVL